MIQMLELRYAIRAPEAVLKHTWQNALSKPVLADRDTIWAATTHHKCPQGKRGSPGLQAALALPVGGGIPRLPFYP